MAEGHESEFSTNELNRDVLSTPYRVRTNWHVITGAPSCGKTTLIELLAERGFRTVAEGARQYMEAEIARGPSISEIHEHGAELQRRVADTQREIENGLSALDLVFLDGALPGSLARYRVFGLDPNEVLPWCFRHRYASVFVLDRLPLESHGLRFEDDLHVGFLDEWIASDYRSLGYEVTRVPVRAPGDRAGFGLDELGLEVP